MQFALIVPILLVASVVVEGASTAVTKDASTTTTAKPTKKFPKKYDPAIHSVTYKDDSKDSYSEYRETPSIVMEPPLQEPFYDMIPPPEHPYTSYDEGGEGEPLIVPEEFFEIQQPYEGYGHYEPEEGEELSPPEVSSYDFDPRSIIFSQSSISDVLSDDMEPPPEEAPPGEDAESSYSRL